MFILRFTVHLPLTHNLVKTENRELKLSAPAKLLKTYRMVKQYENVFFTNIKAFVVFEEEIDLDKFNRNILKEGLKSWNMSS